MFFQNLKLSSNQISSCLGWVVNSRLFRWLLGFCVSSSIKTNPRLKISQRQYFCLFWEQGHKCLKQCHKGLKSIFRYQIRCAFQCNQSLSRIQIKRLCLFFSILQYAQVNQISIKFVTYTLIKTPKVASQRVLQGNNQGCKQVVIDSTSQNKWVKLQRNTPKQRLVEGADTTMKLCQMGLSLVKT